jgi:glyoxylase-like metal-dependent hydrolase (beta-lactamase superfamily II)
LGLDNLTVLRSLVQTTPRTIFPDRRIGCLDDGCEASVLVLRHDPLIDLGNVRDTRLRMRRGVLLPGAEAASFSGVTRVGAVTLLRANQGPLFDNVVVFDGPDGVLLVDAAYESTADSLDAAVRRIAGTAPAVLINTHFHHAGGNSAFPGARVVAHAATAARMRRASRMYGMAPIGPWADDALPDTTIGDRATLDKNGERVELIHLPAAHTDGDLIVVFPRSGVVATGDVFAPLLNPCDFANGCRWSAYVDGIERLLTLVPRGAVVFPGHGPATTRGEIEEFAALLREVTARTTARIAQGWSRDRVIADGLPAQYADWGTRGIDPAFFLGNAFDSIVADAATPRR